MNMQSLIMISNAASQDWFQMLMSGFIGAISGGLISGLITRFAMKSIDNQAKRRWEKDSIQKYKNDKLISSIEALANCCGYIESQNLLKLEEKILKKIDKEYSKPFYNMVNELSKLSTFYKSTSETYKDIEEIINMTIAGICILFDFIADLNNNESAKAKLEKYENEKKIKIFFSETQKCAIIDLINYLVEKQEDLNNWPFGNYVNILWINFETDYKYNFVELVKSLYTKIDNLYGDLKKTCEI